MKGVELDEFGHVRPGEIDTGDLLKDEVKKRLDAMGIKCTMVSKNIGYELRCAESASNQRACTKPQ